MARCRCVRAGARLFDRDRVLAALADLRANDPPLGLVCGAGPDAEPGILRDLAGLCRVYANAAEVYECLADPDALFGLFDRLRIAYPAVRRRPPRTGRWLIKQAGSSGGLGVQRLRTARPCRRCSLPTAGVTG